MRSCTFACLIALVAACTTGNPLYTPGDGDMPVRGDGAVSPGADLAGLNGDLALPAMCGGDQRTCSATASQRCVSDHFVDDRVCPSGSVCHDGYCGKPPLSGMGTVGKSCVLVNQATETSCITMSTTNTPSCQPFITGAPGTATEVTWICDTPVGSGNPGTACTQGSQCRSGFCGSNGTCFRACASGLDCPSQGPKLICSIVTITVEGRAIKTASCIPQ